MTSGRANELKPKGIHYVDAVTSGGVWGSERGYCLMIGGEQNIVQHLDPIFATLAPGIGTASRTPGREKTAARLSRAICIADPAVPATSSRWSITGSSTALWRLSGGLKHPSHADAGRKTLATDAETTPLRQPELYQYEFCLPNITEVWRRGSVIASWLLDLTATELLKEPSLEKLRGTRVNSGEGRWTIKAAIDEAVPAAVLSVALYERFSSRGNADFADRVLSAMRHEFGGRAEKAV